MLLGCNQYVRLYFKFKEAFSKCYRRPASGAGTPQKSQGPYARLKKRGNSPAATSRENLMGPAYFKPRRRYEGWFKGTMDLQTLYVHHRLVVLRVN